MTETEPGAALDRFGLDRGPHLAYDQRAMQLRPSVAHVPFDPDRFVALQRDLMMGHLSPERSRLSVPPAPLRDFALLDVGDPRAREARRARGEAALRERRVAALILNGGMATRFGGVVKGVVPVVPGRPDLSFLAVKLAGVRAAGVPAVVMHSFATEAASREHLETIDWAGIPPEDRYEFLQSLLPRVKPDGTPLVSLPGADQVPDTALYAAPGHGDALRRVRESGVVAALRARGVEHVLVSNVDNLGATLDPVVLGAHLEAVEAGAALSVEVVRRAPGDAGGCVAELAGRPAIVESFRLPPETSLDDYPFFNTNTLWITLDALEREYPLSWFPVKRTIPWPASGELPVIQFEQLIGQITEFAPTRCLRVDRARFLPIKTRAELDAAQPAMRAIVRDVGLDPGPEPPAAEPSPTATPGLLYKPPAMADALDHYLTWRVHRTELDIELDFLDAQLDEPSLTAAAPRLEAALDAMHRLESGAVANIDEGRMVGHYWLREPERAPDPAIAAAITASWRQIEEFAAAVAEGRIAGDDGRPFTGAILVGIGGSALGPQLLEAALAPRDCGPGFRLRVLDNTDPAGIQDLLDETGNLAQTLILVVSKSGSTVETRNGMLELRAACARQAIDFARRAVAVTCEGSALDQLAEREGWLARFPMWDWVGGRTSVMSPVGLLPAALLGLDWRGLLRGAAAMDHWGRVRPARRNPAALLAWMWHQQGSGRGLRDMVILPYKDRLALLSRYLQQLVMESLGKRLDRKGREVWQGLSVYGNKGSTDQHAYVQQLRDGLHNFFVLFLRVLRDDAGGFGAPTRTGQVEVEPQVSSGDCLDGFYQGTRAALSERGRASATIVLPAVDAVRLGALIALFERAVGIYAELIDVNAYHQPGVEAGKQAAKSVLALQVALLAALPSGPGKTCRELAEAVGADPLAAWQVLRHLAANGRVAVDSLVDPTTARFSRAS